MKELKNWIVVHRAGEQLLGFINTKGSPFFTEAEAKDIATNNNGEGNEGHWAAVQVITLDFYKVGDLVRVRDVSPSSIRGKIGVVHKVGEWIQVELDEPNRDGYPYPYWAFQRWELELVE